MSIKIMDIEAEIEQDRNNLFRISTDAQPKLMDRALLAGQRKLEWLLVAEKLICDIIE